MAVTDTQPIQRIPFTSRPAYGSPYPSGLAYGHNLIVGDATGGVAQLFMTSVGGFIYRVEGIQFTRSDTAITETVRMQVRTDWLALHIANLATGSQEIAAAWEFFFDQTNDTLFTLGILRAEQAAMLRRLPLGYEGLAVGSSANIIFIQHLTNTTGVAYRARALFSYWDREALYRPGFMAAFYDTPEGPSISPTRA